MRNGTSPIKSIRFFNTYNGEDYITPEGASDFFDVIDMWESAHRYDHYTRITNDVRSYKNARGETIILAINSDQ